MPKPDASEILASAPGVTPQLLGYETGVLPADENVVTEYIDDAWDLLTENVGPQPSAATVAGRNWNRALRWLVLASLYAEAARNKALYIGHVTGRAAQVNIPANSVDALWRAVADYQARVLNLYPLLPIVALEGQAEGGQVVVQRVYN